MLPTDSGSVKKLIFHVSFSGNTRQKKEGVHQSSNTRHANAHSTNDEDTPEIPDASFLYSAVSEIWRFRVVQQKRYEYISVFSSM